MRKVSSEELKFIDNSLKELKVQLDRIMEYIKENPWTAMDNNVKSDEFKFQTELFNNHTKWMKSYLELSGVYEFYNEAQKESNKGRNVRQGHEDNPVMDIIKNDDIDSLLDEEYEFEQD